ncbi:Hypothetical predicted protein [Olea europaea subsp. europaea]|uniref:Uncharacterized protein n=1 Tax=Olea europaea subsp. europaea TaxID=158383 RepID=A0A8S0RBJ4_OLEEU|nr:Hypothetical predicted protein [Olea europaea subsp. europaea]
MEQTKQQYNYQRQQLQPPPRRVRAVLNADSCGRGRACGRGRGRGWSKGGYASYQENGGYSNWSRGGKRGVDWGYHV